MESKENIVTQASSDEQLKEKYGGKLYRCVQAHTSQTGWEPPNAAQLRPLHQERVPVRHHEGEQGVHAGRRD